MKAPTRRVALALAFSAWVADGVGAAPLARPAVGHHAALLCVATLPKPPSCGPAQVDLRADGRIRLRVDDIVYNLHLRSSQVDVVVMHHVVQIDGFTAPYEWVGNTLQFRDGDRDSVYEIRFAQGQTPGR